MRITQKYSHDCNEIAEIFPRFCRLVLLLVVGKNGLNTLFSKGEFSKGEFSKGELGKVVRRPRCQTQVAALPEPNVRPADSCLVPLRSLSPCLSLSPCH